MVINLIVVVAIAFGLNLILRLMVKNNFGTGLGVQNNKRWGIDDDNKDY